MPRYVELAQNGTYFFIRKKGTDEYRCGAEVRHGAVPKLYHKAPKIYPNEEKVYLDIRLIDFSLMAKTIKP